MTKEKKVDLTIIMGLKITFKFVWSLIQLALAFSFKCKYIILKINHFYFKMKLFFAHILENNYSFNMG
jgi:hypothetical protein